MLKLALFTDFSSFPTTSNVAVPDIFSQTDSQSCILEVPEIVMEDLLEINWFCPITKTGIKTRRNVEICFIGLKVCCKVKEYFL